MRAFDDYARKSSRRVIGLSASLAGVDAVMLDIAGAGASTQLSLLRYRRMGYSADTRSALTRAISAECPGIDICRLNFELGYLLADAAVQVTRGSGGVLGDVDLIGCGGLTLYQAAQPPHDNGRGDRRDASMLQIGELAVVAEQTDAVVVGDFAVSDVAAGGSGRLTSFVDFVLFHHNTRTRAVQTIDRVASLTLLPAGDDPERIIAFDTGPGHGLVDRLTEIISEGKLLYDHDGRLASLGQVHPQLLEQMMSHAFIQRTPPKAVSGGDFGAEFITEVLDAAQHHDVTAEDLLATATAFTAESIARCYRDMLPAQQAVDEIILGGGGSYNATLRRMLKSRLPGLPLYLHEDFGVYGEAKSAIGCAILANETMLGRASNPPRATGASHPRPLGKIVPGPGGF